jgi:hypothetical protein
VQFLTAFIAGAERRVAGAHMKRHDCGHEH